MIFLVDESVGAKIVPVVLRALGAVVYTVADHFGQGAPDEELAQKGWCAGLGGFDPRPNDPQASE